MTIRPLTTAEVPRAAALTAGAFHDDPLYTHLYPDPVRRRRGLQIEYRAYLRRIYLPAGVAETSEGVEGIALWLPPDAAGSLGWRERLLVPTIVRAVGWRRALVTLRDYAAFEAAFPDAPCWYLGLLAVAPASQGRGVGSALLRAGLERADRDGLPTYLETGTESNVAFYERHGFLVTGTISLPYGPDHWAMWREPAALRIPSSTDNYR